MLSINRWVALGLLAFSSGYGYLALTYRILPFERFMAMKPNTLPIGLAVAGMICSIALLLMPEGQDSASGEEKTVLGSDHKYLESPGDYEWGKGVALLVSTSMFLITGGIMLGERKYWILVPVSCFASFLVWYLVDEVLTIFMRPLPMIFYQ